MGMAQEFKAFVMRGNVVDMAVGVIIGGAFGKIVNSVIEDLIMPVVGLAGNVDFSKAEFVLKKADPAIVGSKDIFLEGIHDTGAKENEANGFAANILIPQNEYRRFITLGVYSKIAIKEFAGKNGIAPGIVVGRLQHDGHLPMSHCNDLKRRFQWTAK